jgi:hypothetical protein
MWGDMLPKRIFRDRDLTVSVTMTVTVGRCYDGQAHTVFLFILIRDIYVAKINSP